MNPNLRKKPLLPDGSEVYIGLVVGGVLGVVLFLLDFPFLSYFFAAILACLFCVFGIQFWTEDDRQYWRGRALMDKLERQLQSIHPEAVKDAESRTHIRNGLANIRAIFGELLKKSPTIMYGGVTQVEPNVRYLATAFDEYVDLQNYPRKAGDKYGELMLHSQQAFDGFDQETSRMLERVNQDDILNLTVSTELLRSLRNLLSNK